MGIESIDFRYLLESTLAYLIAAAGSIWLGRKFPYVKGCMNGKT